MARPIQLIKQGILDSIAADPNLSALNSKSFVSIFNLWAYIVAVCVNLFEQTLDIFKTELETIVLNAVPATEQWWQSKVFAFQNGDVVQVDPDNFAVDYAVINPANKIITRCSVKTAPNKVVNIKVAKSTPPTQLLSGELSNLKAYVDAVGPAGIQTNVINLAADFLSVTASVFYNGQYSITIQASVKDAINNYLANLPFDGVIKVSGLEDAIQAVPGVNDVYITQAKARAATQAFSAGVVFTIPGYNTISGYVVEETTSGATFADTITYTVG